MPRNDVSNRLASIGIDRDRPTGFPAFDDGAVKLEIGDRLIVLPNIADRERQQLTETRPPIETPSIKKPRLRCVNVPENASRTLRISSFVKGLVPFIVVMYRTRRRALPHVFSLFFFAKHAYLSCAGRCLEEIRLDR